MNKRKIRHSLLACCLIFGILLTLAIGFIGFKTYEKGMFEKNLNYATSIIDYVMKDIDVEEFSNAVDGNIRNEELVRIEKICDKLKQTHTIEYLYIVKPLNLDEVDNMKYILTGETNEDRANGENVAVGQFSGDEYTPAIVKHYFEAAETRDITHFVNKTTFGYMHTFMRTIFDINGTPIAVVSVDLNMNDIISQTKKYISVVLAFAFVILCVFIIIFYMWLQKRIVKPISLIQKSTFDFVDMSHKDIDLNDLTYNKPLINTRDEIESLSTSVDTMANDLKKFMVTYLAVEKEKNKIASELSVATHIQASMLPSIFPPYPNDKRFCIHASMNPAKEVGGDFYDFFMVDENHLAIVVADVSGKGIPAALFMVIGKTLIKDHTLITGNELDKVFYKVNNLLCESNGEGLFITAFEAIIDLTTGEMDYVNAGHELPFIIKKNGEANAHDMKAGFVLAGMDNYKYKTGKIKLEKGDKLFEYTDGVTEATSTEKELFGMDRLKKSLETNGQKAVDQILTGVKKDIDTFVGDAPQFDDITMLCLELK